MKKLSDLIGLRIVTLEDGLEIGIVRSVVINPETGSIDYFATEKGVSILKSKAVKTSDIEGIGEYAITVMKKSCVLDLSEIQEAVDLVHKGVEVVGTRILTRKGRLVGEAINLIIDDSNMNKISAVEIINPNISDRIAVIPSDKVLTYGQSFLVVQENFEMNTVISNEFDISKDLIPGNSFSVASVISQTSKSAESRGVLDLFQLKQKQFMKGKKSTKTITDKSGKVLVSKGDLIDDLILENVKNSKMMFELIKALN